MNMKAPIMIASIGVLSFPIVYFERTVGIDGGHLIFVSQPTSGSALGALKTPKNGSHEQIWRSGNGKRGRTVNERSQSVLFLKSYMSRVPLFIVTAGSLFLKSWYNCM